MPNRAWYEVDNVSQLGVPVVANSNPFEIVAIDYKMQHLKKLC